MIRFMLIALALAGLLPTIAVAQEETPATTEEVRPVTASEILKAILLPRVTQEARDVGVAEEDIRVVLEESRRRRVPAERTQEVFEETTRAAKENGPVDNFGAFVQARLDEGLRGRELAEAIHAEHRVRGKGKGWKDKDKKPKKPKKAGQRSDHDDGDVHEHDADDGHKETHGDAPAKPASKKDKGKDDQDNKGRGQVKTDKGKGQDNKGKGNSGGGL